MRTFGPDRVLVIAVGIDEYRRSAMRLSGAAAYAERFANWALRQGVPAHNIMLASGGADRIPGIRRWEPTQAGIIDLLRDAATRYDPEATVLREPAPELLLMYWCGHGLLQPGRKRVLFTSDAESGALRVHLVEEIRNYLGSTTVKGALADQIIFIDACADFYHEQHLNERLVRTTLNIGDPKRVRQYVLHSTSEGQSADYDNMTRSSAFSDLIFHWLATMTPGELAPDIDTLNTMVRARFDELTAVGGTAQTPVWQVEDTGGASYVLRDDPGREIVESLPFRHFEKSFAKLLEWWTTAQRAGTTDDGAPPDIRPRLIAALRRGAPDPSIDDLDATELVARVFSVDKVERLFEILRPFATTDQSILDLLSLRIQWFQDLEVARVEQHFSDATNQMILNAYLRAHPSVPDRANLSITTALHELAGLPGRDGKKPLHRFIADLEESTKRTAPDRWFGISDGQLAALRRDAEESRKESRRIVVDIVGSRDMNRFEPPFEIDVHLYEPGGSWVLEHSEGELSLPQVRAALNMFLVPGDDCVLGFRVPRAAFDEIPEAWEFSDIFTAPTAHWRLRQTLLHSAERLRDPRLRGNWIRRHPRIRTRLADHPDDLLFWIEHTEPEVVRNKVGDSKSACIGMAFTPATNGFDVRKDPLMAAIVVGAPYIMWSTHDGDDPVTTEQRLSKLIGEGPFDELPARLHYRRQNNAEQLGNAVRLLWDDPGLLPPQPYRPGM
ncbi:VMAP-C domain-containing protein [Nocardia bovistercoris]|uniref:Caspase family protein n=1 Tax=Nocardia bovistercoris TaxID=2785916 RepID=A0A931IDH9_9NOCA|nr:caspase family protein [Nocardia bovistercoris]MBH0779652.1 caspase family protein [Nocardia bovistercoris]